MDFGFGELPSTFESSQSNYEDSNTTENTDLSTGDGIRVTTELTEQQTSSAIDGISRKVQALVEKINVNRTYDLKMLDTFQEKLEEKVMLLVTGLCQKTKDNVYMIFEANSNAMQVKLQELSEVLERCNQLNTELTEASQALASLRGSLAVNQTSGP